MKKYKKHSTEAIQKKKITSKKLWQNDDYRKKQTESQKKAWKEKPTRREKMKKFWIKFWAEIPQEKREKRNQKIKEKRALQDMSFLRGDNNPSKRPEVIAKIKLARQKRKERLGCINLPETREKIRRFRLTQIFPTKDTSIEIKMQEVLKDKKIDFEKHKLLLNKYQVDLFLKPNIVIECDGDYWHNKEGVKENDENKNSELKKNGYEVYRFWEHEINKSPQTCLNKILL